jgi:hypothetical protein
MTALIKDRDTPWRDGDRFNFPLAAAAKVFAGGLIGINSSGFAVKATATTGLNIRGIAEDQVDNTAGANGALSVNVRAGVFRFANSGVNPVTAAHIGATCYAEDDQTVGSAPAGKSVAGIVVDVDSVGVWVAVGLLPYPSAHDSFIAEVTVSSAQLLALFATPQPLVAAPGAAKANILDEITLFLDFATTAYGGIAAGEDLTVKYTDASGAILATIETTGFLDATADAVRIAPITTAAAHTPVPNAALVLHLLVAEIATGDSPLKVRTRYHIIDTAW